VTWQGCRSPYEETLSHHLAGKVRSLREPWPDDAEGNKRRRLELRGPMRDRVAEALYALAHEAEGTGLVAYRLLEAGSLGDHTSASNPVAVHLAKHGAIRPVVDPSSIYFGHLPNVFEIPTPFVIGQFLIEFDGWKWPKLDEWRASQKMRRAR